MAAAPLLRVNGSVLEVIRGRRVDRYPLVGSDLHVRLDGTTLEIAAQGRVLERLPLDRLARAGEGGLGGLTEIAIGEAGGVEQADAMFY